MLKKIKYIYIYRYSGLLPYLRQSFVAPEKEWAFNVITEQRHFITCYLKRFFAAITIYFKDPSMRITKTLDTGNC